MASHNLHEHTYVSPIRDGACHLSSPLPILLIGRDPEILHRRERVIAGRSDLPIRSMNPEQAEACAHSSAAHLWIFCATVELPRLVYLACCVRRYSPGSRLLLLEGSRPTGFEMSLFHHVLPPGEETDVFLDAVSRLSLGL